jgi:hypothetical protein
MWDEISHHKTEMYTDAKYSGKTSSFPFVFHVPAFPCSYVMQDRGKVLQGEQVHLSTLAIPAVITFPATFFINHAGFAALRA